MSTLAENSAAFCAQEQPMLSDGMIFDKYRIIKLIGQGGMSEVYLAEHILLNTRYALKVMKTPVRDDGKRLVKRFLREAKCFWQLEHPNIVRVFEAGCDETSKTLFIAMEYLTGGSLASREGEHFSEEELLNIADDIAGALGELEKHHIVHRDIKPANIMLSDDGHCKLMDLGIAKMDGGQGGDYTLTVDQMVFGTPAYVSPEQCRSPHKADCRADIYSLGATLYFLACGKLPFNGKTPVETIVQVINSTPPPLKKARPDLSRDLIGLIEKMMERSVDRRPVNAAALRSMINDVRCRTARGRKNRIPPLWSGIATVAVAFAVTVTAVFSMLKPVEQAPVAISSADMKPSAPPEKVITPEDMGKNIGKKVILAAKGVPVKKTHRCAFRPVDRNRINSLTAHMISHHGKIDNWKATPDASWYNHIGYAAQKAKKENKMLLIFISRALQFPEFLTGGSEYKKWLEKRFVLLFCDCDYLNMPTLQKQHLDAIFRLLRVNLAPTTIVLGPDGTHLASIPGARNHRPELYKKILGEVHRGRRVHFGRNNVYLRSTEK